MLSHGPLGVHPNLGARQRAPETTCLSEGFIRRDTQGAYICEAGFLCPLGVLSPEFIVCWAQIWKFSLENVVFVGSDSPTVGLEKDK